MANLQVNYFFALNTYLMPQEINNEEIEQEPLKRKLEDLIKKKSEENNALKKLLDGLNKSESAQKNKK